MGRIESDLACLLLVRDTAQGRTLSVANPRNEPGTANISVGGRRVSMALPGGNDAGRSVTTMIKP